MSDKQVIQTEEEDMILSPEEVKARRERRRVEVQQKESVTESRAGKVAIEYESNGRFDCPPVLYFSDYTTAHISDIAMSTEDDLFESLIHVLNDMKNKDVSFNVNDMTLEEFLETLVSINLKFSGKYHTHRWICDCQYNVDPNDQITNETQIDLSTLQYRSIKDADENLRKVLKITFDSMDPEQFKQYTETRYNGPAPEENWTVEDELANIYVKEPFIYHERESDTKYSFRLMRIGDIIEAKKIVREKYNPQIAQVQSKKIPTGGVSSQFREQKKKEIEYLQKQKAKDAILYAKGLSLLAINGEPITDKEVAINAYKSLTQRNLFDISEFLGYIEFGIHQEQELECPICGKISRRWLQQELNPLELLPIDSNTKNNKRAGGRVK